MENLNERFLEKAVVLDWHVDSWDMLGWKDTSATKEGKARMRKYLGPQAVPPALFVANKRIDLSQLKQSVDEEAVRGPSVAVDGSAAAKEDRVEAAVKVRKLAGAGELSGEVKVVAVLYRCSKTLTPTSGHNEKCKLVEPFVVLKAKVYPIDEALSANGLAVSFDAPKDTKATELGIAILVEDVKATKTIECKAFPATK